MSTKVSLLFQRFMYNLSVRIIKFVVTVLTFIFWCLSGSNRNMNTFTFWTNFDKIPCRLKKSIMGLFNKFIFFFYQNLISDFDIVTIHIKQHVWGVISN